MHSRFLQVERVVASGFALEDFGRCLRVDAVVHRQRILPEADVLAHRRDVELLADRRPELLAPTHKVLFDTVNSDKNAPRMRVSN